MVSVALLPLMIFWDLQINHYLVYHRVTLPLPAWLTSGHPVAYGGMKSNVCSGPEAYGTEAYGTWPCFPAELAAWYADVTGIQGWKRFFQPPVKLWLCLLFLAINIGILPLLVSVKRGHGFLFEIHERREERRRRDIERAQRERCTQCCTEIELVELVDSEKQ